VGVELGSQNGSLDGAVLLDLLVSLLGREEVVNSSHSRKAAMVIKEIAAKILPKWRGMCRAAR
jgi:hypothetical protein